jgi:lipopolysaccharide/colanic/teichoic acid biosynthesis glycosyltransferase
MIISKPQLLGSKLRSTVAVSPSSTATQVVPFVAPAPTSTGYRLAKRTLDVVVALLALILLSPLFLLIWLAIKLEDGGPAIIRQRRVGLGGQLFTFYKFRSMTLGVDHTLAHRAFAQQVIRGEITQGPRSNGGVLKPTGDGRVITRVGRILRKTSLDELPQLFNVLNGTMSLVGPRPSMDYEAEAYFDWYLPRLSVLPGITGLAQINGRSSIPFPEIVRWDLRYIEQRSFWLDLKILLKTLPVVVGMRNTG